MKNISCWYGNGSFLGEYLEEKKTDKEVMNLYSEAKITSVVRAGRLRWMGHVERAENSRIIKRMPTARTKEIGRGGDGSRMSARI